MQGLGKIFTFQGAVQAAIATTKSGRDAIPGGRCSDRGHGRGQNQRRTKNLVTIMIKDIEIILVPMVVIKILVTMVNLAILDYVVVFFLCCNK